MTIGISLGHHNAKPCGGKTLYSYLYRRGYYATESNCCPINLYSEVNYSNKLSQARETKLVISDNRMILERFDTA
jgi:hypothetical protein